MIKLCGKHYVAYFLFAALVAATALFVFLPSSQSGRVHANGHVELQLPYEHGQSWMAVGGFDNGSNGTRPAWSPHRWNNGGALDFAPHRGMGWDANMRDYWVVAAASGKVVDKESCYVKILHDDGRTTEYLHLQNVIVEEDHRVSANQRLAVIAKTKRQAESCKGATALGPHLHFTVRTQMEGVSLSGWVVRYDNRQDRTSFTKNGETRYLYQPLLSTPIMCNFALLVYGTHDNHDQPIYARYVSGGGGWVYKGRFSIYASNAIWMKERPAGEQYRYSVAVYNRRSSNWDMTNYVVDLTNGCQNIRIWQE